MEGMGEGGRGEHTLLQLALLRLVLDELLELLLVALRQAVDVEFSVGVHCILFAGRLVGRFVAGAMNWIVCVVYGYNGFVFV